MSSDAPQRAPLWTLGLAQAASGYASGEFSPVEMLQAVLERHEKVEPQINAFAHLDRDGALLAAKASAQRWIRGRARGPLDGAMISVKDNIAVGGLPCAWGSALFSDFVPETDEPAVARLRQAGAVILGKTNVSEFTVGRGNVSTPLFGTTRNPWDVACSPGASSGGAAAALACGVGSGALGTDGGGSIRRPASHCGLLGLKPTRGRVPRADGLPTVMHDCEVVGPMARCTDDLEWLLAAIAGPDPRDSTSFLSAAARPPGGAYRIRLVTHLGDHPVDPLILETIESLAEMLVALGHKVTRGPAPFDVGRHETYWPLITQAGLAQMLKGREWRGRIAPHIEEMVLKGAALSAADYVEALHAFRALGMELSAFFQHADLMLTPSAGAFLWPAEENGPVHERVFTRFVNAAGVPAISVPAGMRHGMPIGAHFVAAFGNDALLFDIARQVEQARPWPLLAAFQA